MKFLNNIDLNTNQVQNMVIHLLGTDPVSPVEGQLWYNSTAHRPKWYSGSSVIDIYPSDTAATVSTVVLRDGSGDFAAHNITANAVTGLAAPSSNSDAANKAYVDSVAAGLDPKASVRAATTVTDTLATAFADGQVIDGVTLVTGDRILIKNQSTQTENGIYVVAASGAPTRSTDADTGAELTGGTFCFVEEGTLNADTGWVASHNGVPTLGSTNITFVQFSSAGVILAGDGLTKTGVTLSVVTVSSSRIAVSGSGIDLASGIATPGTYTSVTVDTYGRVTGGTNPATINKYSALIGDGVSTAITVTQGTHGRASDRTNTARVSDETSGAEVVCDITYAANGSVTFTFSVAPTSSQYRIVIIG